MIKQHIVVYAYTNLYNDSDGHGIIIDGSVDIVIKSGFKTFDDASDYIMQHGLTNCKVGNYYGALNYDV